MGDPDHGRFPLILRLFVLPGFALRIPSGERERGRIEVEEGGSSLRQPHGGTGQVQEERGEPRFVQIIQSPAQGELVEVFFRQVRTDQHAHRFRLEVGRGQIERTTDEAQAVQHQGQDRLSCCHTPLGGRGNHLVDDLHQTDLPSHFGDDPQMVDPANLR